MPSLGGLTMFDSGSGNTGSAWRNGGGVSFQAHAFDPMVQPELFRGVLTRRMFAFLIDILVLSVPVIVGYLFIAVFGLFTLVFRWALFWLGWAASVLWGLLSF